MIIWMPERVPVQAISLLVTLPKREILFSSRTDFSADVDLPQSVAQEASCCQRSWTQCGTDPATSVSRRCDRTSSSPQTLLSDPCQQNKNILSGGGKKKYYCTVHVITITFKNRHWNYTLQNVCIFPQKGGIVRFF